MVGRTHLEAKMISPRMIGRLLFGNQPPYPKSVRDQTEDLPHEGLSMGTLIIGRQGTGKTTSLARQLVEYFKNYPDRAIFVLDWSGSLSTIILELIVHEPWEIRKKLERRIVYDEMGNSKMIMPFPEFSKEYGSSFEEQCQTVSQNLENLAPHLVTGAPYIAGLSIKELAVQVFRLITTIKDRLGGTWQITEAKKLFSDEKLLKKALNKYGKFIETAQWYLESEFLQKSKREKMMIRYAVVALLGAIEPDEIKARVGYYKPGWTPKNAIEKGQMVLVDGSMLINRKNAQYYLFTQVYSKIKNEINKRRPADPRDKPVVLVLDEVKSLLSIPGFANEIGDLSPVYRSRKLQLFLVIQALGQVSDELRKLIWSIGNVVCFNVHEIDEATEIAKNLFEYEPRTIRLPARSDNGQPIVETEHSQYTMIANKIQRMKRRECIVRRYLGEAEMDSRIRYIPETKEVEKSEIEESVVEFKERLLEKRCVSLRDALTVIDNRGITEPQRPNLNNPR